MSTATIPNPISTGADVNSGPLAGNFAYLAAFINSDLVHADGANAMTGELQLVDGNNAASVQQVADAVSVSQPTGAIVMYGAAAAPSGWLLADGSDVSRTTFADLFAVVGTTFGIGDGSTTFGLPNLEGRVAVGRDAGDAAFDVLGETGGSADAVVVSHDHVTNIDHNHGSTSTTAAGSHAHEPEGAATDFITSSGGGSQAVDWGGAGSQTPRLSTATATVGDHSHDVDLPALGTTNKTSTAAGVAAADQNLQPYLVLNYIIKT